MSLTVILAFVLTCILLGLTPGPNMSLIIASTLRGGLRSGLTTLAGTTTGLAILVAVAALGMTSVMVFMSEWFDVVRWIGALYLSYLGARQLRSWWKQRAGPVPLPPAASGPQAFLQGLFISLSNPKVLLFLGAFFPQFVDPGAAPGPQLAILSLLFIVALASVDLVYTFLLARARTAFNLQRLRALDGIAGGLLVAGGLVLATAPRP